MRLNKGMLKVGEINSPWEVFLSGVACRRMSLEPFSSLGSQWPGCTEAARQEGNYLASQFNCKLCDVSFKGSEIINSPWQYFLDEESNEYYYQNTLTNETTWDPPNVAIAQQPNYENAKLCRAEVTCSTQRKFQEDFLEEACYADSVVSMDKASLAHPSRLGTDITTISETPGQQLRENACLPCPAACTSCSKPSTTEINGFEDTFAGRFPVFKCIVDLVFTGYTDNLSEPSTGVTCGKCEKQRSNAKGLKRLCRYRPFMHRKEEQARQPDAYKLTFDSGKNAGTLPASICKLAKGVGHEAVTAEDLSQWTLSYTGFLCVNPDFGVFRGGLEKNWKTAFESMIQQGLQLSDQHNCRLCDGEFKTPGLATARCAVMRLANTKEKEKGDLANADLAPPAAFRFELDSQGQHKKALPPILRKLSDGVYEVCMSLR